MSASIAGGIHFAFRNFFIATSGIFHQPPLPRSQGSTTGISAAQLKRLPEEGQHGKPKKGNEDTHVIKRPEKLHVPDLDREDH